MEHGDARDQRLLMVLMVLTIRASIYCYWKIYFPSGLKEDFLSSDNANFFKAYRHCQKIQRTKTLQNYLHIIFSKQSGCIYELVAKVLELS